MQADPLLWQFVLQIVLILCNAVFACAEIAVLSVNDARLSVLATGGDRRALRLCRMTSQPARFLATIQVAITLSGFLGSAFAADNFSERLVAFLIGAGLRIPEKTLDTICVVLITMILSYFTLVFGELVPKRLAMKNAEKLALALSGLIAFISTLFKPIVSLLTASTNGILRLLRIDPNQEDDAVTEEEIRMLIDVGSQKGAIDVEEKQMLQNVFEFDDISAGELATHRTMVDMLRLEDDDAAWSRLIHETRHSYYPVCQGNTDNIIGILDAKDYFRLSDRSRENVLKNAVSEPCFIPESVKADALFADMKKRRNYFCVVLDEYGGVEGIVTMTDLIEEIVGDFADEDADGECIMEPVGDGMWRMSGSVPLDAITDALHIEFPDDGIETLGGLIFSTLTAVPQDGAQFSCTVAGLSVEVLRIENHRIEEALVRILPADGDAAPDGDQESATAAAHAGAYARNCCN